MPEREIGTHRVPRKGLCCCSLEELSGRGKEVRDEPLGVSHGATQVGVVARAKA